MNLNGLLYGAKLLSHVDFPTSEVLGPDASEDEIQALIDRHGLIFIKPVFRGGVGKKGKAGLVGKVRTLKEALAEKERLYFCEHRLSDRDLETAAFTVFLYGRMIGSAAEIDDHLNRGRNMDTRTPASACAFVV